MNPQVVFAVLNFFGILTIKFNGESATISFWHVFINISKAIALSVLTGNINILLLDNMDNREMFAVSTFLLLMMKLSGVMMVVFPISLIVFQTLKSSSYVLLINKTFRLRSKMIETFDIAEELYEECKHKTLTTIMLILTTSLLCIVVDYFINMQKTITSVVVLSLFTFLFLTVCFYIYFAFVLLQFIACSQKILSNSFANNECSDQTVQSVINIRLMLCSLKNSFIEVASLTLYSAVSYMTVLIVSQVKKIFGD